MSESIDMKEMGARGNGKKDNAVIFQRALDMGVRRMILDKGDYYISKPLVINSPDVEIVGKGPEKTTLFGDHSALLDIRTKPVWTWKTNKPIFPNTTTIAFEHPGIATPDMIIHIAAPHGMPENTSGGYTSHHTARITSVQNDQIQFDRPTEIPFSSDITISVYPNASFTLRNLTMETDHTPYIVEVKNRQNVRCQNVVFRSGERKYMGVYRLSDPQLGVSGIATYGCTDVMVDSCRFEHIWYGLMAHEGCYGVQLSNSTAFASRHINNNGIGTDHFRVVNCITDQCEGGFNSHPTALGTTFIHCSDLRPNAPSTFDGRRDSIRNCVFDHGIRLSTDTGIQILAKDTNQIHKILSDTHVRGGIVSIMASNVRITRCIFESPVLPYQLNGYFDMDDVTIDLSKAPVNQSSALTVADTPADGLSYTFTIRNLTVLGPRQQKPSSVEIGVYVPMRKDVSGDLENVVISGFEKGLVLYGGEESKERYRGLGLINVQIRKCEYGIYQQDFFDKPLRVADVRINECVIDDNAPGRIIFTPTDRN